MHKLEKKFPSYFSSFVLPEGAKAQELKVYRACKTQQVDRESFLNSFEENGFKHNKLDNPKNPILYSLSTYEHPKHVKRFATIDSKWQPPYKIAVGITATCCGVCERTRDSILNKKRKKDSHVNWWLYEGAEPHMHFTLIDDFNAYLENYAKKKGSEIHE